MGNTISDKSHPLLDKLDDLEHHMASVKAMQQWNKHYLKAPQTSNDIFICGAQVTKDPRVKVLVGPVVGTVTHNCAYILLEVESVAEITCHLSVVDEGSPSGRVITSQTIAFPAQGPKAVVFDDLKPNTQYRAIFDGVDDPLKTVARFKTLSEDSDGYDIQTNKEQKMNVVFVSEDDTDDMSPWGTDCWEKIARDALDGRIDLIVHTGGQISSRRAFRDAMAILKEHECSTMTGKQRVALEEQISQRLQQAYRESWMGPHKRKALACCSNIMVWSEADICPQYSTMSVPPTLLRLQQRVYRMYQRQLWDPSMARVDYGKFEREFKEYSVKMSQKTQAIASGEDVCLKLRGNLEVTKSFLQNAQRSLAQGASGGDLESLKISIESAKKNVIRLEDELRAAEARVKASKTEYEQLRRHIQESGQINEEQYCLRLGSNVALLALDFQGNKILPDGSIAHDEPLLGKKQFEFVKACLESDVQRIIIVSEIPLVLGAVELPKTFALGSNKKTLSWNEDAEWNLTKNQADKIANWNLWIEGRNIVMDMISEWVMNDPVREVLMVSGGLRVAGQSIISSQKSGCTLSQWMLPPLAALPMTSLPSVTSGKQEHWSFDHQITGTSHGWFSGEISLAKRTPKSAKPNTGIQSVPGSVSTKLDALPQSFDFEYKMLGSEGGRIILRPVVGKVTESSAVVLTECDRECELTLTLRDSLTGRRITQSRKMPRRRPLAFVFEGLQPAHRYDILSSGATLSPGLMSGADLPCLGSVTTFNPLSGHARVGLCVNERGQISVPVYRRLAMLSKEPFTGPNIIVHHGPLFDLKDAFENMKHAFKTQLGAASAMCLDQDIDISSMSGIQCLLMLPPSQLAKSIDAICEELRDMYRRTWGAKYVRDCLSNISTIMMFSRDYVTLDVSNDQADRGLQGLGPIFVEIAKQVFSEYCCQLWEPMEINQSRLQTILQGFHLPTSSLPIIQSDDVTRSALTRSVLSSLHQSSSSSFSMHRFQSFGPIGVFVADTEGPRVSKSEGTGGTVRVFGRQQWEALSHALGHSDIHTFVLITRTPIVTEESAATKRKISDPRNSHLKNSWSAFEEASALVMHSLSEWQSGRAGRQVLLVAATMGNEDSHRFFSKGNKNNIYAINTTIQDSLTGGQIRQVTSGLLTSPIGAELPFLKDGILLGRWKYSHNKQLHNPGLPVIDCLTFSTEPFGPPSRSTIRINRIEGIRERRNNETNKEDKNARQSRMVVEDACWIEEARHSYGRLPEWIGKINEKIERVSPKIEDYLKSVREIVDTLAFNEEVRSAFTQVAGETHAVHLDLCYNIAHNYLYKTSNAAHRTVLVPISPLNLKIALGKRLPHPVTNQELLAGLEDSFIEVEAPVTASKHNLLSPPSLLPVEVDLPCFTQAFKDALFEAMRVCYSTWIPDDEEEENVGFI